MRYKILGPLEAESDGRRIDLGVYKARAILAFLLINANQVVSTDRLIDELWGADAGRDRQNALWVNISKLRGALEPDRPKRTEGTVLLTRSPGYMLVVDTDALDATRFEGLVAEGRTLLDADPAAASLVLSEALALWRGHALEEFTYESFAQAEIAKLEELRLSTVEDRVGADLRVGRSRDLIGELESLVHQHPLRERLTAHLMVALHRSGRQAEALRAYGALQTRLVEELGVEPSAELTDLEERIVLDDPSLRQPDAARVLGGRPEPGLSIRGYELREQIGRGTLGDVFSAYQPAVGREVAIKVIRPELANKPEFIRRFEAEARQVARLEHPRIVPLYDYWREPDSAFLVMRRFEHGSLRDTLEDRPLDTQAAMRVLDHIAGALAAAHRLGVAHGDVKPDNILLDPDGNAYLADFGMALGEAVKGGGNADANAGQQAPFASPEQAESEVATPLSDIYALGMVAAHALGGTGGVDARPDTPLVGAVSDVLAKATALDPAERYDDVEVFVSELHDALGAPAAATAAPTQVENPYRGLRAFEETDAELFFGRERLIERLLARLGQAGPQGRLVALVGPSGAGKSSVVRAGLVPALRRAALPRSDRWFIVAMTPGRHPFEALEDALLKVAVDPPSNLLERLTRHGIATVAGEILAEPGSQLLLIVDQLEELFSHASSADAAGFLTALADAATDRHSAVKVVATLRADFYDHPLRHEAFGELLRLGTEVITPMSAAELEQAIAGPADAVGVEFESGLVAQIVADMTGQPAALPLMQYALTELFEQRSGGTITRSSYQNLGGVSAALVRRAEILYDGFDAEARAIARDVFLRLVTLGDGGEHTRRRASVAELEDSGGEGVASVLDTFGRHRLVSFDRDPVTRGPTAEIAHEALLTEWHRLRRWIDDARADVHAQRRLASAAAEWLERQQDPDFLLTGARLNRYEAWLETPPVRLTPAEHELLTVSGDAVTAEREAERRRVRRLRRLVAGVAVALVIALVAGGIAVNQRNAANAAVDRAELASLISRSAAVVADDSELALLLAMEAHRRGPGIETEQAVLNALGGSTVANRIASRTALAGCLPFTIIPIQFQGTVEAANVDGRLIGRDPLSGQEVDYGAAPGPCANGARTDEVGWAGTPDGLSAWVGPDWELELEFDEPTYLWWTTNERFLAVTDAFGERAMVTVHDAETGAPLDRPHGGGIFFGGVANADSSLFAVSVVRPLAPEGDGRIVMIDAATGAEVFRVDFPDGAERIAFDPTTGNLIAGLLGGRILSIDESSGEILTDVQTDASEFVAIGARPDGLIVAVTRGGIEVVDRRTGPTGVSAGLQNVNEAHVRPDGTVLTVSSEGQVEIFDPDGSALAEHAWDVDSAAWVAIDAGKAVALNPALQTVETVDLATGSRFPVALLTPEGTSFRALVVHPEPDGVWAMSLESHTAARWEGNRMVQQVFMGSEDGVVGIRAGRSLSGNRLGDRYAVLGRRPDGSQEASLVSLERGAARVLWAVDTRDAAVTHPTQAGGLHVIDNDGTLWTYDSSSQRIGELETGAPEPFVIALDPQSGRVATDGIDGGVFITDPTTGRTDLVPGDTPVADLGFARNGELLAIVLVDGTVRLWDVGRRAFAGLVWKGPGALNGEGPWYDPGTESLWVYTSGKVVNIPLNPQRWVARACEIVGRDLTEEEWDQLVPGDGPRVSACA